MPQPESRSVLRPWTLALMMALVALFVIIPFQFWRSTWFGRPLTEQETGRYLADKQHPRKIQHALAQIGERILRRDPAARQWYPQVQALANHPLPELRMTVAWVMGQDRQSAEFHQTLVRLVADPEPLVRRNAALSLVRFGDTRARAEIRAMLQPYTLQAPHAGTLRFRLKEEDTMKPGTLIARIQPQGDDVFEVRSPVPGHVQSKLAAEGTPVQTGDPIVLLAPGADQVWEALRALYVIGQPEDLPEVERFVRGVAGMPERIQQQALLTAESIRSRNSHTTETGIRKATP